NGLVKVDGKTVREERYNLGFGDILTVKEDSFILWFGPSGKFILKPYDTPEVKLMKVVSIYSGKKGKKILFTNDGRNIIYDGSIKAGDSIKYNLKEKKVIEIIPFEQGREAVIYRGKNLGKSGKIEEIVGDNSLLSINGEKLTALSDACMVL
ncbi:MAG: hypothetical protein RAK22_01810, partial [Nanoarchaeota archaeon]|nr:hypothetical protein [Nanoarchaeota archaeon]